MLGIKDLRFLAFAGAFLLDTFPPPRYYRVNKFALRSKPEFHAEWLRDEPYDATATDQGSYIPVAGANSLLETGYMRFGCEHLR